jgi:hypothetical protein
MKSTLTPEESSYVGTVTQRYMEKLVLPAIIEILVGKKNSSNQTVPVQIGSGFYTFMRGSRFLATAKHCLLGHNYDETIDDKLIFLGGLRHINDLKDVKVYHSDNRDVSLIWSTEFNESRQDFLRLGGIFEVSKPITIGGFLARDFKRPTPQIKPKPYFYTGKLTSSRKFLTFSYAGTNKGKAAATGARVTPPSPAGLSGGPVICTRELFRHRARAIGVFTEYNSSTAMGKAESIQTLSNLYKKY